MKTKLEREYPDPHDTLISICTTNADQPEYERVRKGLVKVLRGHGGYIPEVDDIWIYQIATWLIYMKKSEGFLDSPTATEYTYARVSDTQLKFQRIIDTAMEHLAINRRDRLSQKGQQDLTAKLREEIEKAKRR